MIGWMDAGRPVAENPAIDHIDGRSDKDVVDSRTDVRAGEMVGRRLIHLPFRLPESKSVDEMCLIKENAQGSGMVWSVEVACDDHRLIRRPRREMIHQYAGAGVARRFGTVVEVNVDDVK